jgi:hypothetical protein
MNFLSIDQLPGSATFTLSKAMVAGMFINNDAGG